MADAVCSQSRSHSNGVDSQVAEPRTPKTRYRLIKRRFKLLVYENECYQEELRNLQRKLLKLSRDKNFLLDRLLHYEKLTDSSDDSDSSIPSIINRQPPKKKTRAPAQRRKPVVTTSHAQSMSDTSNFNVQQTSPGSAAVAAVVASTGEQSHKHEQPAAKQARLHLPNNQSAQ